MADIQRVKEKMDAAMKHIVGTNGDFIPFEQRYEWLRNHIRKETVNFLSFRTKN